ncbi:MAG: hypothetical protein WCC59_07145, partial [Terriglobales bacterium]
MSRRLSARYNLQWLGETGYAGHKENLMKVRTYSVCLSVLTLVLGAWAQQPPVPGIITSTELKQLIPQNYFFGGRIAPVQAANAAGVRFSGGKLLLTALLDTSGYATALPQKLQGLLITETPVSIEGSELKPGAYGFGFISGKFVVMNVGEGNVLSVAAQRDEKLRPAVPLKIIEQGGNYRLYAGRDFVTLKRQ